MLKPLLFDFGSFPIYQTMLAIAFFAGLLTLNSSLKKLACSKYIKKRTRKSFFIGAVFGLMGANVANWFLFENAFDYSLHYRITQGGYTFYFGMLCFFGVSALVLRLYKLNVKQSMDIIVRPLLIAQFFGRIGCSLRGCCWGSTVELFGTEFLLPVREIEAVFVLILFFVLSKKTEGKRLFAYLVLYSSFRFVAEFFRADERGSLFGIDVLSPTQIVALITIAVSVICFVAPKFIKNPPERKYEPLPNDYVEPAGKKHPFKVIFIIFLVIALPIGALIYFNPLSLGWFEDIRYAVSDTFSFIYDAKSTATAVGQTNATSVLDVTEKGVVENEETALSIIKECDSWADFNYTLQEEITLENSNKMLVFSQTVNGKTVLGNNRILVTDEDNNALYVVGDSASLSLTNDVVESFTANKSTIDTAFPKNVTILEKKDYWYDTGDGLIAVYHAMLSDDGETAFIGAVVQESDDRIICYTTAQLGMLTTHESINVHTAYANVKELVEQENLDEIKRISKDKHSPTLERELCLGFVNSDLTLAEFDEALETAEQIAEKTADINTDLYLDIVAKETESHSFIEKSSKDADETATAISAQKRKSSFKHSVNFEGDTDVFTLTAEPNHSVQLTLSAEKPIDVEVYSADGDAIVSVYVEDKETLTLYPEDGTDFSVKVSDVQSVDGYDNADYKITVQAKEEKDTVPVPIKTAMYRLESSYRNSNLASFISMCAVDGERPTAENLVVAGLLGPAVDSCASCFGLQDGMDATKSMIAAALAPEGEEKFEFALLRGTELDLGYISHIETETHLLLKMSLRIRMDGFDIYNGYSFARFEKYTAEQASDDQIGDALQSFLGVDYFLCETNTDELYAAFGDTADSIRPTSDLGSLYELCEKRIALIDGYEIQYTEFDEQTAYAKYGAEKAQGFAKFVARNNVMTLKMNRSTLQYQQSLCETIGTHGNDVADAIDFVTNPVGTVVDKLAEQNETTDTVWFFVKGFTGGFAGAITDEIKDEVLDGMFDSMSKMADSYQKQIDVYDKAISQFEQQYELLNA